MPFCPRITDPSLAEFVDKRNVHRVLRASTDAWDMGHGVSWVHYTPYWPLQDIDHAPQTEVARFLLPAIWMTFEVDNRNGTTVKSFLFSLLDPSPSAMRTWGDHHGFVVSKQVEMSLHEGEINEVSTTHAVAVPAKTGKLLSADQVLQNFGVDGAGTAIGVDVPPGQMREFTLILAHYDDQPLVNLGHAKLYLARFYSSINPVVEAAVRSYPAARRRSEAYRVEVKSWGLNEYRPFLYGHALAWYMSTTQSRFSEIR